MEGVREKEGEVYLLLRVSFKYTGIRGRHRGGRGMSNMEKWLAGTVMGLIIMWLTFWVHMLWEHSG